MTRDEVFEDIERTLGAVPEFFTHLPDSTIEHDWAAFKAMEFGDTSSLSPKMRELIGLAVAAAIQCPYLQFLHREAAAFYGATDEELDLASRMALHTAGWSSFITATGESLDQFKMEMLNALEYRRDHGQQKAA